MVSFFGPEEPSVTAVPGLMVSANGAACLSAGEQISPCEVKDPTMQVFTPTPDSTSAQALAAIGQRTVMNLQDRIHDICVAAQRNGMDDLSGKEIQERYERLYSKRIDASSVSARINNLISAKRLERLTTVRPCRVTGHDIHPVRVPATQARLVG